MHNNKKGLLQRFCLIVRPQSLRLSVLVSVAAASSSVKYCSSCSSSPQRCLQELQLCYVCKRVCVCTFSSMWYLSFPFPTSNLHKEKRSEIEFLSSRTNGWKCLKEYSSAMLNNVLPKEYCSFVFLRKGIFKINNARWCNKFDRHCTYKKCNKLVWYTLRITQFVWQISSKLTSII